MTNRNTKISLPPRSDSATGLKGVTWNEMMGKWNVQVSVNGQVVRIGQFVGLNEAVEAYDDYVAEHFENPYLNRDHPDQIAYAKEMFRRESEISGQRDS